MDQGAPNIYRPRRPERTDLHLAIRENLDLFFDAYDEQFLDQHGPLSARAYRALPNDLETISRDLSVVAPGNGSGKLTPAKETALHKPHHIPIKSFQKPPSFRV